MGFLGRKCAITLAVSVTDGLYFEIYIITSLNKHVSKTRLKENQFTVNLTSAQTNSTFITLWFGFYTICMNFSV